ncbi:hypothetical protein HYALB_00001456 [Hymenoscyphus albidus]|uniref:Uncharacterized protein n=1 Tax=Hymenoscyphus albidus TaxID=595503 RepID=A0A9N9LFA4_9HELO|nr:hypothetical protein HYALB_00001456 [Hymenoscyphus albidus]
MHPETPELRNHGNQPWASHFIVRKTGQIVPLIAVDELPPSLHIDGVPRYLSIVETKGMLKLGLQEEREGYYRVTRGEAKSKGLSLLDSEHNPAKSQSGTGKDQAPRPAETEVVSTTPRQPIPTPKSSSLSPSSREDWEKSRSQQLCRHWAKGLDDRIVRKETRRWEDDESADDGDISSLPPRREVDTSEAEAKRKEKLVDI